MMTFFRTLVFLWPFLKEMILGGKTIRESLSGQKRRVGMLILVVASFGLNFFLIPKVIKISTAFIDVDKKYKKLKTDDDLLQVNLKAIVAERDRLSMENGFLRERARMPPQPIPPTPVIPPAPPVKATPSLPAVTGAVTVPATIAPTVSSGTTYDRFSTYGSVFERLHLEETND